MNQNLIGSIYEKFSIIAHFVPSVNIHSHHRQYLFLVARFLKISSETFRPNKTTFYRKHLWKVPYKISSIHLDWTKNMVVLGISYFWLAEILKIFTETRRHNELLLCRNDVWEIQCKISIFRANHTINMATIGRSCLWLTNLKNLLQKPFGQINWNLVGSTYRRFCIKFAQNKITTEPLIS